MRVAVVDPMAGVRRSVEGALAEDGHTTIDTGDPLTWAGSASADDVLVVAVPTSVEVSLLATITSTTEGTVVALVEDGFPAFSAALASGATSAVERSAEPARIAAVVEAAVAGDCLLPRGVAAEMARAAAHQSGHPDVRARETQWIRRLASGATVAALAEEAGYSEREMFRLLHALYLRMGARNRTEALVMATRWGLLEEE